MTALRHTRYMTATHLLQLWRQPWWIAVTLVQPVIWLLLFGSLFEVVSDIPGFGSESYIEYLAPGIVVMLIAGRVAQNSVTIAIQSLIIVGIALVAGAGFPNGVGGVLAMIGVAVLIGACFGTLSIGFAHVARKEETLIATLTFLQLPLSFLSSTFMQPALMPDWMRSVADFNPLEWAVEAARAAALGHGGWDVVVTRSGLLLAFLALCAWFALWAQERYQRSL